MSPLGQASKLRVRRLPQAGFTLVEMLVVMVLLGLVTGLALPSMQRWYDGVQAQADGAVLVAAAQAAAFGAGARRQAQRMTQASFEPVPAGAPSLESAGVARMELPAGWTVVSVRPAGFLASGLCEPGGADLLSSRGVPMELQITGPLCEVVLTPREAAAR